MNGIGLTSWGASRNGPSRRRWLEYPARTVTDLDHPPRQFQIRQARCLQAGHLDGARIPAYLLLATASPSTQYELRALTWSSGRSLSFRFSAWSPGSGDCGWKLKT